MQLELERADDADVAPAAPHAPEEVGVLPIVREQERAAKQRRELGDLGPTKHDVTTVSGDRAHVRRRLE